ncbi:MAG: tetratricopeptide repeat protein [Bacteroidia bacterium]|nr:tetratricopeptide repeat protein [Bacteroidia bacterium]
MAEEQTSKSEVEAASSEEGRWVVLWKRFQQNRIVSIVSVLLVVLVIGWVAYRQYLATQNEECIREMRFAESYFRQDSFEKALKGTATALGFEQLVEEYGQTEAGNLCRLYLVLCYLKVGQYQAAIDALSAYDAPDTYLGGVAWSALGGAYAETKSFEKAAECYEKAAQIHDNTQTSPIFLLQAGQCYELAQSWKEAARVYERILKKYPLAGEAPTAQKYLYRVKAAHVD